MVYAKNKNVVWQTGKVLDTQKNRYFAGTFNNSNSYGTVQENATGNTFGNTTNSTASGLYYGSSSGSSVAIYRVYENYVIDGGSEVYLVEERLRWRWSQPALLTVNGPVKFYIKSRKFHLLDNSGKEHTAVIVKQTLKQ
jgi:hypothetical protein